MKDKRPFFLLGVWAALCALLGWLGASVEFVSGVMAFPFEQLGSLLRRLSLSGGAGNICAIIIYVCLCLLPLIPAAVKAKKNNFSAGDWLLVLLCPVLAGVLYVMINPALISFWGEESLPAMKAIFGGVCWSVLVSWLVLSVLGDIQSHGSGNIQRWLRVLLWLMAAYFAAEAFGGGISDMVSTVKHVQAGNTGRLGELGTSYLAIALQFVVKALPDVLCAIVAAKAALLLKAWAAEPYGEEAVSGAEALGDFCMLSLKTTVVYCLIFNLAQLALIKNLAVVSVKINIPVVAMAFVLLVLLLARFLRENKALKDDNDMFI